MHKIDAPGARANNVIKDNLCVCPCSGLPKEITIFNNAKQTST